MNGTDNFDRAFEYVLRNEGGFTNHEGDSGGATKYGITLGTLRRWWNRMDLSSKDVSDLTRDEAKAIYRAWYWEPIKGDQLQSLLVATMLFDASVLFGVRIAVTLAQRSLWALSARVPDDGVMGPRTLEALNGADPVALGLNFRAALRDRVAQLVHDYPKNRVFEQGWLNRIERFATLVA